MTRVQIEGASWKILSCLCFAVINGLIKWLSFRLPTETLAFFQNLFGFLCLLPFLCAAPKRLWQTQRFDLQIWRVLASCAGMLLWYKAVCLMPIGQAVALNFTGPIITVLGAWFFLGEKLTRVRVIAIGLGFLGGALIVNARYVTGEMPWGSQGWAVFLPLGSASAFAVCTLLNKRLTSYDQPLTIVAYLMGCMIPFLGIMAWPYWVWPSLADLGFLAILGAVAALAHFSLTRSFVCNDVTFLLPFGSARLVASAFIGFIFFAQPLNLWIFAGCFAVLGALFVLGRLEKT